MMSREEIIALHPLVDVMQDRGIQLRKIGGKLVTNRCAAVEHKPKHFCVSVDLERQIWGCADCEQGGSVIDFVMIADGLDVKAAMQKLGGNGHNGAGGSPKRATDPPARNGAPNARIVRTYDYTDESGVLLYQVCRFEPKDFRQRIPNGDGWTWGLGETRRVLYNLPAVLAADFVWLTEGEKDAETINAFGFVGTTNPMGANKWIAEYGATLRGKDVAILPDGDEKGAAHRDLLLKEIGPIVKSLRVIPMPDGFKDVSDYAASFPTVKEAGRAVLALAEKAEVLYRGHSIPVQSMEEMEAEYKDFIARAEKLRLSLAGWLPGLREIRALVPGEVMAVLAATGCGKTMLLHNIAFHAGIETLLFELELPASLSFERLAAMAINASGGHVESMYRMTNGSVNWRGHPALERIHSVHKPRLTPKDIARIIESAELKTSRRPALVLVDYVQLIAGTGDSRYERTSLVMEEMKIVARETGTIVVIASQIGRSAEAEVTINSGKDSGSIENSAGIVLGAWRGDEDRLWIRILKNTKGRAGLTIPCRIRESLRIIEETTEAEPT